MTKELVIDKEKAAYIRGILYCEPKTEEDCFGEDDAIVYTVEFEDGYEMDIKVCGVQFREGESNLPWTEAVLFRNGQEVCCSEPDDVFFGEWILSCKGKEFVAFVKEA